MLFRSAPASASMHTFTTALPLATAVAAVVGNCVTEDAANGANPTAIVAFVHVPAVATPVCAPMSTTTPTTAAASTPVTAAASVHAIASALSLASAPVATSVVVTAGGIVQASASVLSFVPAAALATAAVTASAVHGYVGSIFTLALAKPLSMC